LVANQITSVLIRPLPVEFKLAAAILFLGAEASFDFTPFDNNCDKDQVKQGLGIYSFL